MDKSIFNFKVIKKDGTEIDLHDKDIWVEELNISSPNPKHELEGIPGQHGLIHLGTTLEERNVSVGLQINAEDATEFDLIRKELYRIFSPTEIFYIVRDIEPNKRIPVLLDGGFDVSYLTPEDGEFQIDFVIPKGYLESIIPYKRIFNTSSFSFVNTSDVVIDAREHDLSMVFKGSVSSKLIIENETTGDKWEYGKTVNPSDVIKIDRLRSLKNNLSITRDTNKGVITLVPGSNKFSITGAQNFTVTITYTELYY